MRENRYASSVAGQSVSIDAGLRSYMLGVYNHMTTALALTGFAAFGTKLMVQANPAFWSAFVWHASDVCHHVCAHGDGHVDQLPD